MHKVVGPSCIPSCTSLMQRYGPRSPLPSLSRGTRRFPSILQPVGLGLNVWASRLRRRYPVDPGTLDDPCLAMVDQGLLARVHDLTDLELALLLCLVSREHGLLSTPADALDDLVHELRLVLGPACHWPWAWVLTLACLGSRQDVRPPMRRRRLHPRNHARAIRSRPPLPPARPRERILPAPIRRIVLCLRPAPSALALRLAPDDRALCPHRKLCPRKEPRPRPARRPDTGPRAAPNPPPLHPHLGPGCAQAVRLCARARRRDGRRGTRHGPPQRFLIHCALAPPGGWLRQPRRRDGGRRGSQGCLDLQPRPEPELGRQPRSLGCTADLRGRM